MIQNDSNSNNRRSPKKFEQKPLSMLNRFVDRIRSTFQRFQNKPQQDIQLVGRIRDLQRTANSVLEQLCKIKDDLKSQIDPKTFSYVEEIIEPVIKEVSRLHKTIEQPGSIIHQAKTYQRYSQWIEKAKLWVQICSKASDKEALIKAIIRYTIEDFLEVIDRDIQVINDYQEHMLEALAVEDEEKIILAQTLETQLQPYLKSLSDLRAKPRDLPLHEIALWKAHVDKRREKYFDAALHMIDKMINSTIPDTSGHNEHEHLAEVLSQIVYLENEAPKLYDEIDMSEDVSGSQIKIFESRLITLEQEIHQLNLDLRLTPDLLERLLIISEMLDQAKQKLEKS